jgi:hypothetical protein
MSYSDNIRRVIGILVSASSKPYATCWQVFDELIAEYGPGIYDVLDKPDFAIYLENETVPECWKSDFAEFADEKCSTQQIYLKGRSGILDVIGDPFELKSIKATHEYYEKFGLDPNEVNSVQYSSHSDHSRHYDSKDKFYLGLVRMGGRRPNSSFNYTKFDYLSNLVYILRYAPEGVCVRVTKPYPNSIAVLFYKKARNLKREAKDPKVLKLIEEASRSVNFDHAFGFAQRDSLNITNMEASTYRHGAIDHLAFYVKELDANPGLKEKLFALAGLGKTSCTNRLTQYMLERYLDGNATEHTRWLLKNYDRALIQKARDLLESRYQSYLASKKD